MINLIKIDNSQLMGLKPILNPVDGTWIAGGAIRQWFVGSEPSSDIDVFGKDQASLDSFVAENLNGAKVLTSRDNLTSFNHQGTLVQVIKPRFYSSVEDLLDSFDFNVCQFCWDGKDIWSTTSSIISVLRGHLAVHKITKGFEADSLRRAFKYQQKGYKPCLGTIQALAKSFTDLTGEEIDKQIAISPGGGVRTVGID